MGMTRIFSVTSLVTISIYLLSSCGYDADPNRDTPLPAKDRGGIACQVVLAPNADGGEDIPTSPSGNICRDYLISKIAVTVIDVEHDEVATAEPVVWDCDIPERKNSIGGLKPSSSVRVIVEGFVEGETDARWAGMQEDIVIEPGKYTDIGEVVLACMECEKDPPELLDTSQDCVDLQPTLTLSFSEDIVPDSIADFTLWRHEDDDNLSEVTRLDFDPDTDYNALTHQIDLLLPTLERASRYTVTINSSDDRGIQDRAKNVSNGNLEFSFSTITNWYVDGQVSSSGDGTSWAEAFATIQEGIDYSVENGCDEVWVKRGQYIILIPIEMNKAIGIYGGFGGSESSKVDRTIDMERLSMIRPSYDEEDYTPIEVNHLMRLSGSGAAASESHFIIDGFEFFSGGHEESAIFEDSNEEGNGGGIYSNFAGELADHKLTIKNCSFSYNSANSGGAIYLNRVDSAIIQECNFNYNEAVLSDFGIGGAILSNQSDLMIFGCKFRWNKAIKKGGALYQILDRGNSRIINSVFSSNNVEEEGEGGAISLESSSSKIVNCTFYNNGSNIRDGEGLSIYGVDASPVIVNSIFWNNEIDKREIIFSSSTPNVSTCIIKGGYEGEDIIDLYPNFIAPERGDFHIYNNSPCVDKGSNEAFQVLNIPSQDYDGNKRIVGIIDNSNPLIDIGAFEYQGIQEGVVYY